MFIYRILEWFKKAVPEPTPKNFNTQLGCHVEEFVEMLERVSVSTNEMGPFNNMVEQLQEFANDLKQGLYNAYIDDANRIEFLDALCDQVVTGTGLAYYQNMDIESALDEVCASNESKFDVEGNPIFDENQKIKKGPHYYKPDLRTFV